MDIPPDQDSDDPWTLLPGGAAAGRPESDRSVFQVDTIEGVEPLDTQVGVFLKKTVPDALHDALFGQPEPTAAEIEAAGGDPDVVPPMQTYAILDAAKVTNLPELLERSGLDHRCLFKGVAYDELKNVAPWIVRLAEDNTFTRNLFTRSEAHWHLWGKEPGIYVRSRRTLDDIWRHCRKFTRVQDEEGKWYYLRFWMKAIFFTMGEHISEIAYMLLSRHHAFLFTDAEMGIITNISTRIKKENTSQPIPKISKGDLEILDKYMLASKYKKDISHVMPQISSFLRASETDAELHGTLAWLEEHGFSDKDKRRVALAGFLTARFANCQREAKLILENRSQGPGVRIWHLSRLIDLQDE